MIDWKIHHREVTVSTNLDARGGRHGDVFTADFQTAGRGRLDHKWLSPPKTNLMMSVVLSVEGLSPEQVSTIPLVVGLAVVRATAAFTQDSRALSPWLKWPNDVLFENRKISGILCERVEERVVAGIGVNVKPQDFPPEIAMGAGFLGSVSIVDVRDRVLSELEVCYGKWLKDGFSSVYGEISDVDCLKGRFLSIVQTDQDEQPIQGLSGGILPDGSLDVGGTPVYAGEAHVEEVK